MSWMDGCENWASHLAEPIIVASAQLLWSTMELRNLSPSPRSFSPHKMSFFSYSWKFYSLLSFFGVTYPKLTQF